MGYQVVWRLRDQDKLQRELETLLGGQLGQKREVELVLGHFQRELQLHPVEWPSSPRKPSEHTWRFGRVVVQYRLIPDAQSVEILSVSGPNA
jgi:hypothetical protein